jgi:CheY-like chemotaxis protein
MAKSGPIIIVEDDQDDLEIMEIVLQDLGIPNKLIWFANAIDAFAFLKTTREQPFLIFSDINMPQQSGIEFKRDIDNDPELRHKSIPFVFYSTSISQEHVNEAYTQLTVQGFFQKADNIPVIKETLKAIIDYWKMCRHPNSD